MPTVLVTGASRGIGRATALRMTARGWQVLGGVRSDADGEALAAAAGPNLRPVRLDLTSAADVAALASLDGLDAVVNNAGFALQGPVETLDLDDLRRQLEINVVGQVAVTQAVLPTLRERRGRIVFISSVSGRVSTPMTGAYNASKFALEALADALRVELRPWQVPVVLVEPGATSTDMWHMALDALDATHDALSPAHRELYAGHFAATRTLVAKTQRQTVAVERVATVVETALRARAPRARYLVRPADRVQTAAASVVPTVVLDAVLGRVSGARAPRRSARG